MRMIESARILYNILITSWVRVRPGGMDDHDKDMENRDRGASVFNI